MKKLFAMMMALAVIGTITAGAARAADRDTPEREARFVAVTAAETIGAGTLVAIDSGCALARPAADAANYAVIGRAESSVVSNQTVLAKRGAYRWANGGAFTKAHIGQDCYVSNAYTVCTAALATHDVPAGLIVDVDAEGVWVDTYNRAVLLTSTVTALGVTGNATVGGTLGITGNTTVGGTLGVTGVATLTAAPKFTALTAGGTVTATATNAPALVAAASPKWITVAIGSEVYVVPAWQADD